MLKTLALLSLLIYPHTPNATVTPGSLCDTQNADFIEFRYQEHIPYCARNVSSVLKAKIYEQYGIPEADRDQFTIDHLIPLSIGGSNDRSDIRQNSGHRELIFSRTNFTAPSLNSLLLWVLVPSVTIQTLPFPSVRRLPAACQVTVPQWLYHY